jgi:hypothetical protein
MSRAGILAALGVVLVVAVAVFAPRLTSREISYGTPVPQPVAQLSLFPVPRRAAACLDQVAVEPGIQVAVFGVDPSGKPGPRLRFSIRSGSYEREEDIAGGYGTGQVTVPFAGPPRPELMTVCVRNLGGREVSLVGTNEPRTLSRPRMTIAGKAAVGEFSLAFASAEKRSAFALIGPVARRISAFKPVWVQPWVVAFLLAAVLAGAFAVPLLVLWRAFAADEREARSEGQ